MTRPKTLQLLDGTTAPWIAFGTGTALYGRHATEATLRALNAGFTHIDTAQAYANEDSTGDAIQQYLKSNTSKARTEIYVTTKLAQIPAGETVETTLKRSLEKLKLDYVDLFLVHNPAHHVKREGGLKQVWKEMIEVKKKGLTKSIGVSNANVKFLEEIISIGEDIPTVNQIEYHPLLAESLAPLVKFHAQHKIITSSYGGLTPILPSRTSSDPAVTAARERIAKTVDNLAERLGAGLADKVTPNQVLLKWLENENVLAVTTTSKESRLREYLTTENLPSLTPEEIKLITEVAGGAKLRAFDWVPHMDEEI